MSTALPIIVSHLHGTGFIWADSAYTIASTTVVPLVGNLVSGFGRKPVLLSFILAFAVGSAILGAAQSVNMLIAGRAIQGFGGGGCLSITEIIYADMIRPRQAFARNCFRLTGRSTVSILLAITWGGLRFPWTSSHVPAPLIIGGVGIVVFFVAEYLWLKGPTNYVGWSRMIIGFGLFSLLDENTSCAMYIGLQVPLAVGLGIMWVATEFPILASLPFSNSAQALAFFTFFRCFAMSWGIVIGGTILRTSRPASTGRTDCVCRDSDHCCPRRALALQSTGGFHAGERLIWLVMTGLSGVGLLTCVLMSEVELRKDSLDEKWGLQDGNSNSGRDEEKEN
ncbi:hypothetical protein BV20DRAFT_983671 [Pilatotrama ljubarskyi]|nr:hypothetical protein BV20DRAFT_983671 [Pilatotrama ljubarskyi]